MFEEHEEWVLLADNLVQKPVTNAELDLHKRAVVVFRNKIQRRRTIKAFALIVTLINTYVGLILLLY